jgi:hypothetical protein
MVHCEDIEMEGNFTGIVRSIKMDAYSNFVVSVQKTMPLDDTLVVITATNPGVRHFKLMTNLAVGKTYMFPECVSSN